MKSRSLMSLLGGAAASAAEMYLFDPDMGKRRRQNVASQASDCMEGTRDLLETGWEKASGYAGDLGHTLADKAQEYGSMVSNVAHQYGGELADHAMGAVDHWTGRARDAQSDLSNQA